MNVPLILKKLVGKNAHTELFPQDEENEDDPYTFAKRQFKELARKNLSVPVTLYHL